MAKAKEQKKEKTPKPPKPLTVSHRTMDLGKGLYHVIARRGSEELAYVEVNKFETAGVPADKEAGTLAQKSARGFEYSPDGKDARQFGTMRDLKTDALAYFQSQKL